MGSAGVRQLTVLAELFKSALDRCRPESVALLGEIRGRSTHFPFRPVNVVRQSYRNHTCYSPKWNGGGCRPTCFQKLVEWVLRPRFPTITSW